MHPVSLLSLANHVSRDTNGLNHTRNRSRERQLYEHAVSAGVWRDVTQRPGVFHPEVPATQPWPKPLPPGVQQAIEILESRARGIAAEVAVAVAPGGMQARVDDEELALR